MKAENVILDKSFKFGLRILKLYLHLRKRKVDAGLCSQVLNSSTSVGANVEEAVGGSSRKGFINKLQIRLSGSKRNEILAEVIKGGRNPG